MKYRDFADLPIGLRIRHFREEASLTGEELAEALGWSQSKVSRVETGRVRISLDDVEAVAQALALQQRERDSLRAQAEQELDSYQAWRRVHGSGMRERQRYWVELEREATKIRVLGSAVIPGLLQTPEYARHVLALSNVTNATDLDEAVAGRMIRQQVLQQESKDLQFVILEQAVRTRIAPAQVLALQLHRLLSLSALTGIRIGVVPWTSPLPLVPMGNCEILDDEHATFETYGGEGTTKDPSLLSRLAADIDALDAQALHGDDLRKWLRQVADELQPRPV